MALVHDQCHLNSLWPKAFADLLNSWVRAHQPECGGPENDGRTRNTPKTPFQRLPQTLFATIWVGLYYSRLIRYHRAMLGGWAASPCANLNCRLDSSVL